MGGVRVRWWTDPVDFARSVTPVLARDPVRATLVAGVVGALLDHPSREPFGAARPLLGAAFRSDGLLSRGAVGSGGVRSGGAVRAGALRSGEAVQSDGPVAVLVRTPPHPVTLVVDPASVVDRADLAAELAAALVTAVGADPVRFTGPQTEITALVEAWARLTGHSPVRGKRLLLYVLSRTVGPDGAPERSAPVGVVGEAGSSGLVESVGLGEPAGVPGLVEPVGVPGSAWAADLTDPSQLDLLARWFHDFSVATGEPSQGPDPEAVVRRDARGASTVLWWRDGRPVAVAGHGPPALGVARIGPVWTPPEERGHGFGSAVTAAAVQSAHDLGAEQVVLFTDADYLPSNRIYRRLDFVPVTEFAAWDSWVSPPVRL